jgi:hypothetical protein
LLLVATLGALMAVFMSYMQSVLSQPAAGGEQKRLEHAGASGNVVNTWFITAGPGPHGCWPAG